MVINIASYAYAHPGGTFLLEYNVGRDISKFFYGAYALDGNGNNPKNQESTKKHAHSNIARKIANLNSVGIFKEDSVRWENLKNEEKIIFSKN